MNDQGTSVPAAPSQDEIANCREIVAKADRYRELNSYLGIDGLPLLPTDVESIGKYIEDYINTADRDKLQKIIYGLNQKWSDPMFDERPADRNIYDAASVRLNTLGGRPKPSKKRPTARRRRSSKRKVLKARTTRRR